jgi:hypothetical protein
MSKKAKLEKNFKDFNLNIEQEAANEIKKIQEETFALKEEASKIGEAVEHSVKAEEKKTPKKKVNT